MYAVTDRRAVVCRALFFSPGWSLQRAEVGLVRAGTWPGGRGEILFEPRTDHERSGWPGQEATGFLDLDDAGGARQAVERMLGREIPEESRGRAAAEVSPPPFLEGADDLPGALRDRLAGELAEGERVHWLGRPPAGVMALRRRCSVARWLPSGSSRCP